MKTQRKMLAGFTLILAGLSLFACNGRGINPNRGEVTVIPATLTLYEGRYAHLRGVMNVNGPFIIWRSSNSVARVSSGCCDPVFYESASVKALQPGTARITAYVFFPDGAWHCDVTVLPVTARRIDIRPDTLTLTVDSLRYIYSIVYDSVGVSLWRPSLDWHSADSTIASVREIPGKVDAGSGTSNSDGLVVGRRPGRTYIIASIGSLRDSSLVIVE